MRLVLRGLAVMLPLLLLGALVFWVIYSLESLLGAIVKWIAPDAYSPGMGIALGIVLSFGVGVIMSSSVVTRAYELGESWLRKIPLVKTVYGALHDLSSLLSTEKKKRYDRVVLVTMGETGIKIFGFVTREDLTALTSDRPEDSLAVYLPMSYQIGGYLALVPRASVEPVAMSIEDASRLVFTAAMSVGDHPKPAPRSTSAV